MQSLESLRREVATTEVQLNQRVETFSSAVSSSRPADEESGFTSGLGEQSREIETLFEKFGDLIDRISKHAASNPSRMLSGQIDRYRQVLQEQKSLYRRAANILRQKQEQNALLREVKGAGVNAKHGDRTSTDWLLTERSSLTNAHHAIDDVLAQAAATRESLSKQRNSLSNITTTIGRYLSRVPGASTLIQAIHTRRRWNDRVVAITIALCICFWLWWVLRRS